jgi:hypothetical protein
MRKTGLQRSEKTRGYSITNYELRIKNYELGIRCIIIKSSCRVFGREVGIDKNGTLEREQSSPSGTVRIHPKYDKKDAPPR